MRNFEWRFAYLITGKTSYHNSTALLTGLTSASCSPPLSVSIWNYINTGSVSALCSYFFWIWRPPALPHRYQCSTIGRLGLNHRVRDGNGCYPQAHRHQKFLLPSVRAGLSPISIPLCFFSIDSIPLMHPDCPISSHKQACSASAPSVCALTLW